MESMPRESGSEEYLDSEKYQLRSYDLERPDSLWPLIARINRIRRENACLQADDTLTFCDTDNDQLLAYVKHDPTASDIILTVVNLDPYNTQSGWLTLDLAKLRLAADQPFQVHDLLSDQRYQWCGSRKYIALDPRRS